MMVKEQNPLIQQKHIESKTTFLTNKQKSTGVKHFINSKAFVKYSNEIDDIYKKIEEYNPNKQPKMLIVFDDMIADMFSNENVSPIVTELFIRGRKLNNSFVFITQSYFTVSKNIKLSCTHCFIMKIPNKRELQQIAFNDSSYNDFMNLAKLYFL